MEIQFFLSKTCIVDQFGQFVATYRVTNVLPKLINMLLFSTEKTEFPFLVFPYFPVMPLCPCLLVGFSFLGKRALLFVPVFGHIQQKKKEIHKCAILSCWRTRFSCQGNAQTNLGCKADSVVRVMSGNVACFHKNRQQL